MTKRHGQLEYSTVNRDSTDPTAVALVVELHHTFFCPKNGAGMLGRIETAVRHQKERAGSQDRLVLKFNDVAQFASKCVRSSVYVKTT